MDSVVKRKTAVRGKANNAQKLTTIAAVPVKSETVSSIHNNKDYERIMARIDELIEIPDSKLTKVQAAELHRLAKIAQQYEKSVYTIKPPSTFEGILEMKMYELKLTQGKMAKKLKISDAKLSLILSGKQQPDIKFLKAVHESLGIDGNYLLSVL